MNISPIWINRGQSWLSEKGIKKAEAHYNATYIGDFCLKDSKGNWSEREWAVFWKEFPEKPEYSNYFGLLKARDIFGNETYICNAISVTEGHWNGCVADDGEIIYSRSRHDFRESTDGSVTVDGGRDYFKRLGKIKNPTVRITIVNDQLVVNDSLLLPCEKP